MNLATLTASDLQIAGLTPMSSVDWPGKFVATVFAQGCPWACPYCHNQAIIDPKIPGVVSWESVEELLGRRRGLLDGVVFSGGEATRQLAVLPAMQRVRELGFEVGLHTAGPYPARLREILRTGLVDWVGIDIKAMSGPNYEAVAGRPNAGPKAWESLGEVLDSGVPYEVRLTVYPDGPRDGYEVASCVKDLGATHFALQQARALGTARGFNAGDAAWDLEVRSLADDIEKLGFESFQFRPA